MLIDCVSVMQQYWVGHGSWKFVPVATFAEAFIQHKTGRKSAEDLAVPFDKSTEHKDALVTQKFSLSSTTLCSIRCAQVTPSLIVLYFAM